MTDFSHINAKGNPTMVDVGLKTETFRSARAKAIIEVDDLILEKLESGDLHTKKGPVFQIAIIAGIMGIKKTSELIPLCHQLNLSKCDIKIKINENRLIEVESFVSLKGQTGVEMEALTGVTIASLTIYDMCKAISQNMRIKDTYLIEKTGGKNDIKRD